MIRMTWTGRGSCDSRTVLMLERGQRTPPLETLEALAKALEVAPQYLLQELESKEPGRRGR